MTYQAYFIAFLCDNLPEKQACNWIFSCSAVKFNFHWIFLFTTWGFQKYQKVPTSIQIEFGGLDSMEYVIVKHIKCW